MKVLKNPHVPLALLCLGGSTAAILLPHRADAQVVMGQVIDSISGTSVGTGFVVLLDMEGREVTRALSGGDGRFLLDAPAAGAYRLRSERIGYQAFTSEVFQLEDGQTIELPLRVRAQAIMLAAVQVQGEDRCNANPSEAAETGIVWQEIRKALAATTWDGTQELARYRRYGYTREWDLRRLQVESEQGSVVEGFAGQPFRSIPAAQLADEGYIFERPDGIWYNLPDAAVLQDDEFLATHCFHVVRDPERRPGQIGLAFEPMARRSLPDVRGALWLDETTSELRFLDVTFTELPQGVRHRSAGGTLEFLMLPSGAWIIHRWQLRKPIIRVTTAGNRMLVEGHNRRTAIVGFNDTGADVLEITTDDGSRLYPPGLAHLTGTVYDSTKGAPLAGALISIEGTPLWVRANASGSFHLTAPFEGDYSAVLSHGWIDSIGYSAPPRSVRFSPDDTTSASFAIPHADSIARRICSYSTADMESGTVVGLIRDGNTGRPADGTRVRAFWQVLARTDSGLSPTVEGQVATTNEAGKYVLCGLPVGRPVSISANGARSANIVFPRKENGLLLFSRERDPSKPYTRSFQRVHRTWKLDLLLTRASSSQNTVGSRNILSGYVTDRATHRPVEGVVILLNGTDSTYTRDDGTFDILDVEWRSGTNHVVTRREGYAAWKQEVWLRDSFGTLELSVQLSQLTPSERY